MLYRSQKWSKHPKNATKRSAIIRRSFLGTKKLAPKIENFGLFLVIFGTIAVTYQKIAVTYQKCVQPHKTHPKDPYMDPSYHMSIQNVLSLAAYSRFLKNGQK